MKSLRHIFFFQVTSEIMHDIVLLVFWYDSLSQIRFKIMGKYILHVELSYIRIYVEKYQIYKCEFLCLIYIFFHYDHVQIHI